ncbi:IS200/IS605 family transposase [Epilithonimonas ginsengisoli]|uniref:IS200/IS605 family transposase n=1 Tax=Epilithonimonas ginsengisoli TaxID=1245592 RepID=A0ABU4JDP6_9FLAO|nr:MULTISPECIES: IS200/IS605 family transposase [Chryseobacterium group]MBV6878943.1 IS200/IS605 family transposase [Epilithonimonas sp. FP105]MDW8547790.1 IS200/IS605 family transposase [Epilithonimonas ginsengisoli]OAH76045.1 transposase [Chryseobacterium sp. FP211-J200]
MANTYTQIYIQIVFAVRGKQNLIPRERREELHKLITGIISNRGQKLFAIFAMPDHIHLLVSMSPNILISDLVRDVKAGSSKFINESNWVIGKFNWQEGYGAFSYSKSHLDKVVNYILNQEAHHQKKTFKEEYLDLLRKFDIDYDEKYVFEWIEQGGD